MSKLIPVLLLFVGESLAIYSEVFAAKNVANFSQTFWRMAIIMTIAGLALVAGYMLGVKYLQNIWVVGAVSITSIVIMEPIITYAVFHELPTKGPLIGLILGLLGLISALTIK